MTMVEAALADEGTKRPPSIPPLDSAALTPRGEVDARKMWKKPEISLETDAVPGLKRGNSFDLGESSKRRATGGAGGYAASGKGKGLMNVTVTATSPGLRGRGTPLISPLGVPKTRWKLASYTVKLNRHHGTVDNFEEDSACDHG